MRVKWSGNQTRPSEINGYTIFEWTERGKKLNSEYIKHSEEALFNRYEEAILNVIKGQTVQGFKKDFVSFNEWLVSIVKQVKHLQ